MKKRRELMIDEMLMAVTNATWCKPSTAARYLYNGGTTGHSSERKQQEPSHAYCRNHGTPTAPL